MTFTTVNPATGEVLERYEPHRTEEIGRILERAHRAFRAWQRTPFRERAAAMRRAGATLRDDAPSYAELMAREMGKPLAQGRGEAEKCAWVCEYYADHAERLLADEPVETDATRSYVIYRPLGVILAIMPWNFPFWQVFRFAAPALMAGNAALLKHAPSTLGCAAAIEDVFRRAGFPDDLFRALRVEVDQVPGIIGSPLVRGVTLTGSVRAGRAVAAEAGKHLKKSVLELGGSDPYVILGDADLEPTVEACVASRLINSGQSCIAAKRFIVVDAMREAFTERLVAAMRSKRMGNPFEEGIDLGPQARTDLRDVLHRQVRDSVAAGAAPALGGERPDGAGAFYPPTVLTDVRPGMPAYEEELFGPVAAVLGAEDEEAALRIANDTSYGLGAAVFTRDVERGRRIARERLDAGCCFVNAFVRSDPRLPFGGIKDSGYGRELGLHGIREFVNIKTVYER